MLAAVVHAAVDARGEHDRARAGERNALQRQVTGVAGDLQADRLEDDLGRSDGARARGRARSAGSKGLSMSLLQPVSLLRRVVALAPRVVVLAAPAGYGKSTFVRGYARTFARAAFCDCAHARDGDGLARAIVDALAGESAELALDVARARLAQGRAAQAQLELAADFWSRAGGRELFAFENADALRDVAGAHELLERLALGSPPERVLAFCTRRPLPVAFSRAIGRERVVTIGPDELRLGADAVAELAGAYGVGERQARESSPAWARAGRW